jgi:cytidylate kinase
MAVITISRELGSLGDEIVGILCQKLGYCSVDKAVLTKIAKDAGVDVKAVLAKEKDVAKKPKLISGQMTSLYGRAPSAFAKNTSLDDQTYAQIVQQTMQESAQEGNVVIVGRGGQMILRDWPKTLHVHLYAPAEIRVQRLADRANISQLEAKRHIEKSDEQKRQYIRQLHHNANWKDVKHYHLAINTGSISPKIAAQLIIEAAQSVEDD